MKELLDEVRQIAYSVHEYLGNGYLEKVYENCLRHRLLKAGHKVEAQKSLRVFDADGFELGEYFADLVVDDCLIVELKTAKALTSEHLSQILNYLKITGLSRGLLINFGSYRFEIRTVVSNFRREGNVRAERGGGGEVRVERGERVERAGAALHALPALHGRSRGVYGVRAERGERVEGARSGEVTPSANLSAEDGSGSTRSTRSTRTDKTAGGVRVVEDSGFKDLHDLHALHG